VGSGTCDLHLLPFATASTKTLVISVLLPSILFILNPQTVFSQANTLNYESNLGFTLAYPSTWSYTQPDTDRCCLDVTFTPFTYPQSVQVRIYTIGPGEAAIYPRDGMSLDEIANMDQVYTKEHVSGYQYISSSIGNSFYQHIFTFPTNKGQYADLKILFLVPNDNTLVQELYMAPVSVYNQNSQDAFNIMTSFKRTATCDLECQIEMQRQAQELYDHILGFCSSHDLTYHLRGC